jgi:hypothetical protein
VTSDVNTNLSLAIHLFEQSSLVFKSATNATGQLSKKCVVPELNIIPTHGSTYLDFNSVLKTSCCEGNEWAVKVMFYSCGNQSASGKFPRRS